jgi:hypothetical protein
MSRFYFIPGPFAASFRLLIMAFAMVPLFTSCKRKKLCPAFSYARYDAWFPYTEGQKLMFMNARQEKDSIVIFQNSRSAATETEYGWLSSTPRCRAESEIKGGQGYTYLEIECDLKEGDKFIRASLNGFTVIGASFDDSGLVLDSPTIKAGYKSTYHSSLSLNGKTYPAVQLFEKDTALIPTESPWRVYVSKESGIIAYERYPSHDLWVKQ